jgi:hypothetical protein
MPSMICSSSGVPSVTLTNACVSPRVNKVEPCCRGTKLGTIVIWRMSVYARPSARLPSRMHSRSTS